MAAGPAPGPACTALHGASQSSGVTGGAGAGPAGSRSAWDLLPATLSSGLAERPVAAEAIPSPPWTSAHAV